MIKSLDTLRTCKWILKITGITRDGFILNRYIFTISMLIALSGSVSMIFSYENITQLISAASSAPGFVMSLLSYWILISKRVNIENLFFEFYEIIKES